jgi:TfoX/Sxy family transcriptional regulator of competence genes
MASKQRTLDFIVEQMADAGAVSAKKMFGEYGLYLSGKLFGLVCDDQLFIKPTLGGRSLLGEGITEAAPYPGAKPCFLIPGEAWEERERMSELARITTAELPPAKRKSPRG